MAVTLSLCRHARKTKEGSRCASQKSHGLKTSRMAAQLISPSPLAGERRGGGRSAAADQTNSDVRLGVCGHPLPSLPHQGAGLTARRGREKRAVCSRRFVNTRHLKREWLALPLASPSPLAGEGRGVCEPGR